MKTLLFLLMFSTAAHAGLVAKAPTATGGEILLTDAPCPNVGLVALVRDDVGNALPGCWIPLSEYVVVSWSDGDTSVYKTIKFTVPDGSPAKLRSEK